MAEVMFRIGLFSWLAALANAALETRSRRDLLQGMSYVAWAGTGLLLFSDIGIYDPALIWGWSIFLLLIQAVFVLLDIIALRKAKTEKVIVRAAADDDHAGLHRIGADDRRSAFKVA